MPFSKGLSCIFMKVLFVKMGETPLGTIWYSQNVGETNLYLNKMGRHIWGVPFYLEQRAEIFFCFTNTVNEFGFNLLCKQDVFDSAFLGQAFFSGTDAFLTDKNEHQI